MDELTITQSLSDQLFSMEKYIKFSFPFIILDSSLNILFTSSKFQALQKTDNEILSFINKKVSKNKTGIFTVLNKDITIKKIGTSSNCEKIFIGTINDMKNFIDSPFYQIAKYCHDTQEPLRNIANFLQLIKLQLPENIDEKTISYIDYAIDNIKTLSQWNKNILSKDDTTSTFSLSQVIDEIKNLIKTQIHKKTCKIILDKNIPKILGNYFEILSLLKNLIENSIKHSNHSPLEINISMLNNNNSSVNIIFKDNGGPLSEESIIKIENEINNNNLSKNTSNGLLRQSERGSLNLLIVEDNPGDEAITRRALSDFKNINILCVHDGAQTMEVLRYKTLCSDFPRPDLIFLDMYLPRRDGLTILKEIKRDRDIQDIPVVILTNNISADLMSLAYKNGASGYICKSFDFMAFKESITDCVKYWSHAVVLPS